jgi:hypothetical protein
MSRPSPSVHALAQRLIAFEKRSSAGQDAIAAADEVFRRLAERISLLVGSGGFHLLLQRALNQALREHPWLAGVQPGVEEPWRLAGLEEAARDADPAAVTAGLERAVAELVALVARFLGADMAIRLVRQSFPELTAGGETGWGLEEATDD